MKMALIGAAIMLVVLFALFDLNPAYRPENILQNYPLLVIVLFVALWGWIRMR